MTTTIALLQHACPRDPAAGLEKVLGMAERAVKQGARIICTQELFRTPYFCQSEDHANFALAESVPGPSTERLQEFAARHGAVIIASLFERRAPGLYHNSAAVIDAGGALLGVYRKMHIPDDPLYYEKFYFAPGDTGFRAWDTRHGRIGVLICWDQWFPEAARLTAMQGAEIIFCPTAIGWHPAEKSTRGAGQPDAWETIQRAHAIANGCAIAAVNRVGHERLPGVPGNGIEFWGGSFVAGTDGRVIARAGTSTEEVLVAAIDTSESDDTRTRWPFLRDRRIDAYGGLTRRWLDDERKTGGRP